MFPTTGILDSFQRANENPLSAGGQWAVGSGMAFPGAFQVISDQCCENTTANTPTSAFWSASQFGPNCEAYATLPTVTSGIVYFVFARIQNPNGTATYYQVGYQATTGVLRISYYNGSSAVQLAAVSTSLTAGSSIGLSCVGNILTAYYNNGGAGWTFGVSVSDVNILTSGYVGMGVSGTIAANAPIFNSVGGGTANITQLAFDDGYMTFGAVSNGNLITTKF